MKICFIKLLLVGMLLGLAARPACSQGILIAQHSGYNDPTTEGFSLAEYSSSVTAVTNDLGMNAWATVVPSNGLYASYLQTFDSQQLDELNGQNWDLSLTLRIVGVDTNGLTSASLGSYYTLFFGSESDGDPFVRIENQSYILGGAGSSYNNYQLIYDASANNASLWVNGVDVINGLTTDGIGNLTFGSGAQRGPAQANWNLLSLEIVPEPSAISLIFLGSGVFVYVRRNRKTFLKASRYPTAQAVVK